ncbi:lipoate--protein ligase family protein [Arthrobacter gandavensis]|uniref:lipoate--protein ligase family protein n=1 Tax=Arthrobacter gandavensis TaxID=169960 RepID=UPI002B273A97|nr:lipoate--protein ligase family protein [Arthrobacter gandavensis]
METRVLDVYRQEQSFGAAGDLQHALDLLAAARGGGLGPSLRIYQPRPTVAFGQRDARLPGFADAAAACRDLGFEPLVRKAGGRAAAYHQGCLVLDHIEPEADAVRHSLARFTDFAQLLAGALRHAGVPAGVGEIPGEYCPGEYSVHGGTEARIKLVGTAQRVVSGAWLFSSVVVIEDSAPLREVLTAVYEALGLDWDPATAGAAEDLNPGLTVAGAEASLLAAYGSCAELRTADPGHLERIAAPGTTVFPTAAQSR